MKTSTISTTFRRFSLDGYLVEKSIVAIAMKDTICNRRRPVVSVKPRTVLRARESKIADIARDLKGG